jgi:hypothetical protein
LGGARIARPTYASAIDGITGRTRFGAGSEQVVGWLTALRARARGVDEAGLTGFALYRAVRAAGSRSR